MFFVIFGLCILAGIIISFWTYDRPFVIFMSAIFGVFASTIIIAIVVDNQMEDVLIERNIYALGDNAGVQGRFFLGSGSVETIPVYFYYSKNSNGSYSLNHAKAASVEIYQDVTTQPYVVKECEDYGANPKSIWTWPLNLYSDGLRYTSCEVTEFHVPPNSIDSSYNLDAS